MEACDWLQGRDKDMVGSWHAILGSGAALVRDARQKTRATSFSILGEGLVSNTDGQSSLYLFIQKHNV